MGKAKICIIDYGSGNLNSIYNIFRSIDVDAKVSGSAADIDEATHMILPGVGAFGAACAKLKGAGFFDMLTDNVFKKRKNVLGICVGMQIFADKGYEHGVFDGLGWIGGDVKKIDTNGLVLPHVGWNNFKRINDSALLKGITDQSDFYYVHSYYFDAHDEKDVVATCEYGAEFPAIIGRDNIWGVQFHPEKSQAAGRMLLRNFAELA